MKKLFLNLLFLLIVSVPCVVFADTYFEAKEKANDYIINSNKSSYEKYLLNNTDSYYKESGFITGGLISKDEFLITTNNNSNGYSYIFNGNKFWTLSNGETNKKFVIDSSITESDINNKSDNINTRVTEYIQPLMTVSGSGTKSNPWIFNSKYSIKLITSNDKFGKISLSNDCDNPMNSVNLFMSSNETSSVKLCPAPGYQFSHSTCSNNINQKQINELNIKNVSQNMECKIYFSNDVYTINIIDLEETDKTNPNLLYMSSTGKFYIDKELKKEIFKIIDIPTYENSSIEGYSTSDGIQFINKDGKIVLSKENFEKIIIDYNDVKEINIYPKWKMVNSCQYGGILKYDSYYGNICVDSSDVSFKQIDCNCSSCCTCVEIYTETNSATGDWYQNAGICTSYGPPCVPCKCSKCNACRSNWKTYSGNNKNLSCFRSENLFDVIVDTGASTYVKYYKEEKWYDNPDATTYLNRLLVPTANGKIFEGYYYGDIQVTDNNGKIINNNIKESKNIILKAKWKLNKIVIVYNVSNNNAIIDSETSSANNTYYWKTTNGKIFRSVNTKDDYISNFGYADYDSTINLADYNNPNYINVTYEGYTAKPKKEWCTEKNGLGVCYDQANDKILTNSLCDAKAGECVKILYLNWIRNTIKVKYNGNGVTGSINETNCNFDSKTCKITTEVFTKKGYAFDGWNTNANGTGKKYASGEDIKSILSNYTGNITLYAQWKPASYKVSFNVNANDGTGNMNPINCKYGTPFELSKNSFKRANYEFLGWATNSTYAVSYYDKQELKDLANKENAEVKLYAKWTKTEYLVVFNSNNEDNIEKVDTVKLASNKTLSNPSFTKTGYTLSHWNTKKDDSGEKYSIGSSQKLSTTVGDIVKLYAQWKPNPYTVVYNKNNGTEIMNNSEFTYDKDEMLSKNLFKKTGYTFAGWAKVATGPVLYSNEQLVNNLTDVNKGKVTLYAQWKPNTYKVTLNKNNATIDGTPELYQVYNTMWSEFAEPLKKITKIVVPIKIGYTFKGYYTATDYKTQVIKPSGEFATAVPTYNDKDYTLYAQWVNNLYNITLDNQGPSNKTVYLKYDISWYKSTDIKDSNKISSVAIPLKSGYIFGGYFTETGGNGDMIIDSTGNIVGKNDSFSANTKIYAYWISKTYKITFDSTGANNSGTTVAYENYGIAWYKDSKLENRFVEDKIIIPIKKGYTFTGYFTAATSGTKIIDANGKFVKVIATDFLENKTIFAQWVANKYTIKYNGNTNTGGATSNTTHAYDTAAGLRGNGFSKTGYTFAGWATSANGDIVYSNAQSVVNLSAINGDTVNLYAKWTPIEYTVKYNANVTGATGTMNNSTHVYDKAQKLSANQYVKTDYYFIGWSTSTTGAVKYSNEQSVKNLTTTKGATINLYAKWTNNSYTVEFNSNDENKNSTYQIVQCNVNTALTANTFVRTGYTFKEWNTKPDGTGTAYANKVKANLSQDVGKNVVLYAQWKPIKYVVQYNKNLANATGTMANTNHLYDVPSELPVVQFISDSYTFVGWNTVAKGTGVSYNPDDEVVNLSATAKTITLYAQWVSNDYKVILDNDSSDLASKVIDAKYNQNLPKVEVPKRVYKVTLNHMHGGYTQEIESKYTFYGYYTGKNGKGTQFIDRNGNGKKWTLASDTTLYAYWISGEVQPSTDNNRVGYKFKQWYYDEELTALVPSKIYPKSDTEIYAKWEPNVYSIKVNNTKKTIYLKYDNGYYADIKLTLPINSLPIVNKLGYVFKGYYTAINGVGKYIVNENGEFINLTEITSNGLYLYEYMAPIKYKIDYDTNGGIGSIDNSVHYYDIAKTLNSAKQISREGYEFAGWSLTSDGPIIYKDSVSIKNLTTENDDEVTLYAQWTPLKFAVTLNRDGGSGGPATIYLSYDTGWYSRTIYTSQFEINSIITPTKKNFTFDGYYKSNGEKIIDSDGTILPGYLTILKNEKDTITLIAKWKANN